MLMELSLSKTLQLTFRLFEHLDVAVDNSLFNMDSGGRRGARVGTRR